MPIHVAAIYGRDELVNLLLDKEMITLDMTNNEGQTPLHLAITNGHVALVKELLKRGANIELSNNNHETPLILANRTSNPEMIECITLALQEKAHKFPASTSLQRNL